MGILDDVVRPLLLSPVSSPPSNFINTVDSVIDDIHRVLDGYRVDLKVTVANYFEALALNYLEDTLKSYPLLRFIRLTITQKRCASRVLFNHIYTNTKSTAELIDLFQNISTAVAIIKQVGYNFVILIPYIC